MATRAMILFVLMVGFQQLLGEEVLYEEIIKIAALFFFADLLLSLVLQKVSEKE